MSKSNFIFKTTYLGNVKTSFIVHTFYNFSIIKTMKYEGKCYIIQPKTIYIICII